MLAQIRLHHVLSALAIYLSVFMVFGVSQAVTPKPIVFVAPIEGVIDLGLAPFA